MKVAKRIKKMIDGSVIYNGLSVYETIYMISMAEFTVTDRLHGAIVSAYNGTPFIIPCKRGKSVSKKVGDFLNDINILCQDMHIASAYMFSTDISEISMLNKEKAKEIAKAMHKNDKKKGMKIHKE